MTTYLDDDSFFTSIVLPGQYGNVMISNWFLTNRNSMFRFIQDDEADEDYLNLKDKLELYPGIKTFATVMNPWARAKLCYDHLLAYKNDCILNQFIEHFDLSSFESFIMKWPSAQAPDRWFNLDANQCDWLEYIDENGTLKTIDYLFKAETLEDDFNQIKEYFGKENSVLPSVEQYPDYKDHYSVQMKQHIATVFAKDIAKFGYKF